MEMRGLWLGAAATAALAGCGDGGEPPAGPSDQPETSVAGEATALTPPIAPAAVAEAGSPKPGGSASAQPAATLAPGAAVPRPLVAYPPRQECAKLAGFADFRDKVFAAAKARDAEALVALADPKINLDFGGGAGRDELRKRLGDPKAELWSEVGALAGLGCAVDGGIATMPWIFARLPESVDDASTAMLGTGGELALHDKPAADATVVRTLAWPLVDLAGTGFDPKARFTRVTLADGTQGYLETAKLRSLLDYRLIADRQDGAWQITALIAGD